MAFVPWPSWLKYQRSENTKKTEEKRRNHWLGVVHCLPTRWPVLSILFFITIIEARLHRVSFETCSPQTPDPIIENDLQGHIYRFCLYNFVEFGTLLHYQERTARIVLYLRRSQGNVKLTVMATLLGNMKLENNKVMLISFGAVVTSIIVTVQTKFFHVWKGTLSGISSFCPSVILTLCDWDLL